MTPDEREMLLETPAVQELIAEAVGAEREACALVAESMDDPNGESYDVPPPRDVAAAIRARSMP